MKPGRLFLALVSAQVWVGQPLASVAAPVPGWDPAPLRTAHGDIVDTRGRTVLLRGVNVNQLNDYAVNDPRLPTVEPLTRADFAGMASLGFNVVRLNLAWSALEPRPGTFDRGYVARVRRAVRDAAGHGIYTVLDMHQDAWGKGVGTPATESCPPPTQRSRGWDGAPAWATLSDGWTTCNIGGVREISPAVARAFQNFYEDRRGVQSHLLTTWGRLAAEFAGEPSVAGYDLLNEPNPGLRLPVEAADQLGRFYQRAIRTIRAAEKRAKGPRRLMFVEPSALWSAFGIDALPPAKYLQDDRLVFSPHLYNESITVESSGKLISIERGMDLARLAARRYGAALWDGEWGWFGGPATDAPRVRRYAAAEDAQRIGGAWWVWRQACGDPHSVGGGGGTTIAGGLNKILCPAGTQLGRPAEFTVPLSRPYPRAAPGRLISLHSDPVTWRFSLTGDGRGCGLDVWIPGGARPALTAAGVTRTTYTQVPGGWRVSGCTNGPYTLSA